MRDRHISLFTTLLALAALLWAVGAVANSAAPERTLSSVSASWGDKVSAGGLSAEEIGDINEEALPLSAPVLRSNTIEVVGAEAIHEGGGGTPARLEIEVLPGGNGEFRN